MTVITLQSQLLWRAAQTPSGNWMGICDAMNIAVEADNLDQLHSIIPETINLLFLDLLQDGEVNQYLRERGWNEEIPASAMQSLSQGNVEFDVPWQLVLAERTRDSSRSHC
jgi:hypothetical protein